MTRLDKRAVYEARTRLKFLEMSLSRSVEEAAFIEERWGDLNDTIVIIQRQAAWGKQQLTKLLDSLDAPMDGRFDYEEVVDRGTDT